MKRIFQIKQESSLCKRPCSRDMHAPLDSLALTQRIGLLKILSYDADTEDGEKGENENEAKKIEKESSPCVVSSGFVTE